MITCCIKKYKHYIHLMTMQLDLNERKCYSGTIFFLFFFYFFHNFGRRMKFSITQLIVKGTWPFKNIQYKRRTPVEHFAKKARLKVSQIKIICASLVLMGFGKNQTQNLHCCYLFNNLGDYTEILLLLETSFQNLNCNECRMV